MLKKFATKLNLGKFKGYLYQRRYFILVSFLIFAFGIFYGYFATQTSPQEVKIALEEVKKVFEPIFEMGPVGQFFFIVLNNGLVLFLTLLLGAAFGVFPFLVLLSNGTILGIVAFFSQQTFSWSVFFLGTLPHGIIEIPVLILTGALGLKIGKTVFQKVFKVDELHSSPRFANARVKQGEIKKELSDAFEFFWKVLLPLLAIAAIIEIFITAKLLGI